MEEIRTSVMATHKKKRKSKTGTIIAVDVTEFLLKSILTTLQEKQQKFFFFKNEDCFSITYTKYIIWLVKVTIVIFISFC